MTAPMSAEDRKRRAAEKALEFVEPGMALGLGTGSTASHFVRALGAKVAGGLEVAGVPTSQATAELARSLGIPLTTLDETPALDVTVDGADELDAALRLIKGGGGALLREKIVASCSRRMVVIADDGKEVGTLGRFPLPVEIVRFGAEAIRARVAAAAREAGCSGGIVLRRSGNGEPFVTDSGHFICDCAFGAIPDPETLASVLSSIPGVVEHGLFIGLATVAILGTGEGARTIRPTGPG